MDTHRPIRTVFQRDVQRNGPYRQNIGQQVYRQNLERREYGRYQYGDSASAGEQTRTRPDEQDADLHQSQRIRPFGSERKACQRPRSDDAGRHETDRAGRTIRTMD